MLSTFWCGLGALVPSPSGSDALYQIGSDGSGCFSFFTQGHPFEELERMLDFGVLILWNGSHASLSFSVG